MKNKINANKTSLPKKIKPMLATLVDQPPEDKDWTFEIKWDGYRALSICNKSNIEILSRNNKSFNDRFYPLVNALKKLQLQAVIDGEIVAFTKNGNTTFQALQNWRSEADGELAYYAFDLLWLNGYDLMSLPLLERKKLLSQIIPKKGMIKESLHFNVSAESLLKVARQMGLEGVIAKRAESVYKPGQRGYDWLKIKVQKRQEVVIGGYTKNENSPKLFSSLLVGVFDQGKLIYTGKIGTGFNSKMQKEMMAKFKPLISNQSPFSMVPEVNKPSRFKPKPLHAKAFWLLPSLVCEVSYAELTEDGIMRHPSFKGMREDKDAQDVHPEINH